MQQIIYGVLGSTGFLGCHLMKCLEFSEQAAVGGSRGLGVDARSVDSLTSWISDNKITHIINLAAECGGIGLNQTNSAELWLSTTLITSAVLEAARLTKISKLCLIGTVCSYARDCPVPFNENQLMNYGKPESTNAAYGVAKLNGLFGLQAYCKQYNMNGIFLLPVNLYGPGDNFDPKSSHAIPAIIRKFQDAKDRGENKVVLWGSGNASREFLYVEDCARAITMAVKSYNHTDPVNIGAGFEITINDLAILISNMIGFDGDIYWDHTKPDGQPRRSLDINRALREFKFYAETPFEIGLERTIKWWNDNK
jgi:GDP-L-fucose synthase